MTNFFKKIIEWKLKLLATWILKRYQPKVIGLTGSVGKTSTKEAIFKVLSHKFKTGKNIKNYNNEIGLPLSIIGMESAKKNPIIWIWIFIKALLMVLFKNKNYPEMLVLEMGADKPGDIKYLVDFVKCHVGVVTAIGAAHLELFDTVEKVAREKQNIISHLKVDDFAILNRDDELVMGMQDKTRAKKITFGFHQESDVKAIDLQISSGPSSDPWIDVQIKGLSFKLQYKGATVPVFLPKVLGQHQVYSALAAAAVGVSQGMNLAEVAEALKNFVPPAGRMTLLAGIKHSSIIDDSYNSSPMAVQAALRLLKEITVPGKKYVVLGDMLELGSYTESAHREVGLAAAEVADVLITSGSRSKITARAAHEAGMDESRVFVFDEPMSVGKFLEDRINSGDIALIKGSQGARMEKVVKEIMAEPEKAAELLVRQSSDWK